MHPLALDAATLTALVSAATAAPSMHNTQPWRFRLDPGTVTVEIHAAAERSLPFEDPQGRALHVAAGAAVFNLRLAVAHFGWDPVVRPLPDPRLPSLLATVRLAPRARAEQAIRSDLYDAIWHRHSSRLPFGDRPVEPGLRLELSEAAHAEGGVLDWPEPHESARLLAVTAEAEQRNRLDPDRGTESRRWLDREGGTGIPQAALGPQDAFEQLPLRDFSARRHVEQLPSQAFERFPTLATLMTEHDRRTDWLRTGQALQHVLLVATAHKLRASLLHQAMEWQDLRSRLRTPHAPSGHVQMLIRLGYGPEGPATPRRAPQEFLDTGDDSGTEGA
ncbi:Acg family FMN-binding oxidoreductase [Streptomyces mesophilus]|uniref:Acg family FMN-binding oxidoreductase n=1 Tax=Streptomyces mesophilus TaxID=1775132 RepID=UPI00331A48BE